MRYLFLDLENTIIDSNNNIINKDKIKKIIEEYKPNKFGIFSTSIYNESALKNHYDLFLDIEQELNIEFEFFPTVLQLIDLCNNGFGFNLKSVIQFFDTFNIQEIFLIYWIHNFKGHGSLLISKKLENNKLRLTNDYIQFMNLENKKWIK